MNAATNPDPIVASAARWFWWIAGLSLVNTVMFYSGSDASFVVGLGMTAIAGVMFSGNVALSLAIIGLILGFYFLMGLYAQRGAAWAFYLGIGLYVVDALIYVKLESWMSVAFLAYAIFCIARGLMRLREINEMPVAANDSI